MPTVTIYTRAFCGYCIAAKRLLSERGIPFEEIDAANSPERRQEMIARSSRFTFPQIFIGTRHVGGYDELRRLSAQGELDLMLAA